MNLQSELEELLMLRIAQQNGNQTSNCDNSIHVVVNEI
jgi:hypothetical protein